MALGPFRAGEIMRIPLAVTLNGQAIFVANPRIYRLINPVGVDLPGYPKTMITVETGIYYLEVQLFQTGNYTAIIRADLNGEILEDIEPFVVEPPNGLPRIECA